MDHAYQLTRCWIRIQQMEWTTHRSRKEASYQVGPTVQTIQPRTVPSDDSHLQTPPYLQLL
jgi:hypothetical protein